MWHDIRKSPYIFKSSQKESELVYIYVFSWGSSGDIYVADSGDIRAVRR
jgi:hypothetical protein